MTAKRSSSTHRFDQMMLPWTVRPYLKYPPFSSPYSCTQSPLPGKSRRHTLRDLSSPASRLRYVFISYDEWLFLCLAPAIYIHTFEFIMPHRAFSVLQSQKPLCIHFQALQQVLLCKSMQ
ncbi:uncharacterized protein BJX67DRAFT_219814 [Aspergillus lucknowensis]|uniref:Uncharacterized protein n=1 Tax=Aspergillus lucknowensis TaxID=176173 RepID=A0ABR4LIS4_9EURO